ncbi:MAG: MarR family transcriptional regulator, partial [Pseudomonadota bacterium]
KAKALVIARPDPGDKRRSNICLTEKGAALIADLKADGLRITEETLAPLSAGERRTLARLLRKIC